MDPLLLDKKMSTFYEYMYMYKLTTVKSHDCLLYERMSRAQNNFLDSGLIGKRNFWLIIKPRFWVVKTLNKNYPMRVSKPKTIIYLI